MRLIALLSWYDESPSWLAELVAGCARAGCDHLIALDGAYQHFPGALEAPRSPSEQALTILNAAHALGMGVTVDQRNEPWQGGEVEKRTVLFELGQHLVGPNDWFLVVDSDEVIEKSPDKLTLKRVLRGYRVAAPMLAEPMDPHANEHMERLHQSVALPERTVFPIRKLFRAHPSGIHLEDNHYTYVDGSGRLLWDGKNHGEAIDALELPDFIIRHRGHLRPVLRRQRREGYYRTRGELNLEPERPRSADRMILRQEVA